MNHGPTNHGSTNHATAPAEAAPAIPLSHPMTRIIRHLPALLRRSLLASFDDGLFVVAKGAAYSALLSFFPLLVSTAAIFVQNHTDYVQRALARFLTQILPSGTEDIVLADFRYNGSRPITLLVLAFGLSLWAALSVILQSDRRIQRGLSGAAQSNHSPGIFWLALPWCSFPLYRWWEPRS